MEYIGTIQVNLDDKNRIIIPAKWRQSLGSNLVLSKGYDGCLMLRSKTRFEEYYCEHLQNLNTNQFKDRLLIRQLLANAADLVADKNFRIMFPKNLIEEAKITKSITLIGLGTFIEVWDSEKYDAYKELADKQLNKINEAF